MGKLAINFSNWKTTATGIVLAITTVLLVIGIVTPEQSGGIQEQGGVIIEAISAIVGAISSIILMFKATDG